MQPVTLSPRGKRAKYHYLLILIRSHHNVRPIIFHYSDIVYLFQRPCILFMGCLKFSLN